MKKFFLLMQIVVFLTATCSGAERKFNDAFVFGVFYGHPSKINILSKDSESGDRYVFTFDNEGALTSFNGSELTDCVRDEKSRLIYFESANGGIFMVEWNSDGNPYKFSMKTPDTKKLAKDFLTYIRKCGSVNNHKYFSSEDLQFTSDDNGVVETYRTNMASYLNPAFDEYGNLKFALKKYATINATQIAEDRTIHQTTTYWPDHSVDAASISTQKETFHKLLASPEGFVYDPQNKRNLYQQLFLDYMPEAGIQRVHQELRDIYKSGRKLSYHGIPYEVSFYQNVGVDPDTSLYYEFHGTRHEINELRNEITTLCNEMGFNMQSDCSTQSVIIYSGKKNLYVSYIELRHNDLSGDEARLRMDITYCEKKSK